MVMYLGKIVELSDALSIYDNPRHPYTKALLSAVPIPDPKQERAKPVATLMGELPSPLKPPSGCKFRTRCQSALRTCEQTEPKLEQLDFNSKEPAEHYTACHLAYVS